MAFEKFLVSDDFLPDIQGTRKFYEFENGLGASVICTPYSYGGDRGLWELAVMERGRVNYNTPVTNDVLGYLTWEEVEENLGKIRKLEKGVYSYGID